MLQAAVSMRWVWIGAALVLACRTDQAPAPTPPPAAEQPVTFENSGGMWMPGQMTEHAQTLRSLGVEFEPGDLTDPTAFPLGAVVSLGGCSGSFVSEQGLVITNHHCVIGALQRNSTPESNLLQEGFLAASKSEEKWAGPQARVYVTHSFADVTGQVTEGLDAIDDPKQRYETIEQRVEGLEKTCEDSSPGVNCRIVEYFEGEQYFQIEQLELQDVRLVYAPHAGTGVFGGEVDNWRWPRHTGDYSFLRAYVGPDGKPAPHGPDNVPYRPEHHLEVATEPLAAGDFAMVAGYPGRTYRFKSADEVAEAVSWYYPDRIAKSDAYIEVLEQLAADRPDLAIKAASRLRRLHNGRTNAKGMLEGLTRGGLADKKTRLEEELATWIAADPQRQAAYGDVLPRLEELVQSRRTWRAHDAAVREIVGASHLAEASAMLWKVARDRQQKVDGVDEMVQAAQSQIESFERSYAPEIELANLKVAFARALALPPEQRPVSLMAAFVGEDLAASGDLEAISQELQRRIAGSKLGDAKRLSEQLQKASVRSLESSRDPFVKIGRQIDELTAEVRERTHRYEGELAGLKPRYVAALRAFDSRPTAPDANGTLRITFGTVRGYRPEPEAEIYRPFTSLEGLLAKHTGEEPFDVPAAVREAAKNAKRTRYVDAALGDVPVDFLADLDITGGNSGSATLNARGELIGLAFDGNYESIASDWVFTPEVTRSIHVDIRYVLWLMDHVDRAHHLMREMGVEPEAQQ